uniref:Uncharacterized protein n=1 Tax=Amphimedon queenslandica TaxID=400682 RepID=A0A1X7SE72_AMPQE
GKPKKENALKTICLMLGPDFISDHITVSAPLQHLLIATLMSSCWFYHLNTIHD